MTFNLVVLAEKYAIYKFRIDTVLPEWIYSSDFYSITRTKDEISVVANQTDSLPENISCSKEWRIFEIKGPLDLSSIGIIADISNILKEKNQFL